MFGLRDKRDLVTKEATMDYTITTLFHLFSSSSGNQNERHYALNGMLCGNCVALLYFQL